MSQGANEMVSVIVVCRNEGEHITRCLGSVLAQFDSPSAFELIVVDGCSTDRTRTCVDAFFASHPGLNGRLLTNEKKTLATGWNLGIRHATGEFVFRPDAHSTVHPGYVSKALAILGEKPEVAGAGGSLRTVTSGYWRDVIPAALSMKTGVGNSAFRTGSGSGYADTAVYAVYRRHVLLEVGGFDEALIRHQDTELHARLRRQGYRLWHEATITADYHCRETPQALWKQMFQIGYHLPALISPGSPTPVRWRHMAPFAFYSCLLLLLMLSRHWIFGWLGIAFIVAYLAAILAETLQQVLATRHWKRLHVLWIIPGMHMAYAAGTAAGWIRLLTKRNVEKLPA